MSVSVSGVRARVQRHAPRLSRRLVLGRRSHTARVVVSAEHGERLAARVGADGAPRLQRAARCAHLGKVGIDAVGRIGGGATRQHGERSAIDPPRLEAGAHTRDAAEGCVARDDWLAKGRVVPERSERLGAGEMACEPLSDRLAARQEVSIVPRPVTADDRWAEAGLGVMSRAPRQEGREDTEPHGEWGECGVRPATNFGSQDGAFYV